GAARGRGGAAAARARRDPEEEAMRGGLLAFLLALASCGDGARTDTESWSFGVEIALTGARVIDPKLAGDPHLAVLVTPRDAPDGCDLTVIAEHRNGDRAVFFGPEPAA